VKRALLLTTTLLLATGPALAQDEYRPDRTRAEGKAKPAASPAARPATPGVQALPAPPHAKDLDPAPGHVLPAAPVPAPEQSETIALSGGTVHTVSGETLAGATVVFAGGRITAVSAAAPPPGARVIDVTGRHVYPGLIAGDTVLGLVEIGAVRATRDSAEVGELNPNARAEVGFNPDSELLAVTRSNGVLTALTAPRGGLISGTGAVMELDGWTWEQMALRAPAALLLDWPGMGLDRSPGASAPVDEQQRQLDAKIERLAEAFATARAYALGQRAKDRRHDRDVKWEAMQQALRREIPVIIHASSIREIEAALRFAEEQGVRLVIEGGQDSWRVAPTLRQRGVAVMAGNVLDIGRPWEPYDVNFTTPLKLHQAGVEFCITPGRGEASNARNLPYLAAKAAAHGLPRDEALKAITLYPARILGVGDRLGSLEPGKDATLFVSDGDPLEIESNVERAFIRGRELDLADRHKRLYERYRLKPRARSPASGAAR
jgi:imidazolonepropionase-like amidohydrolase